MFTTFQSPFTQRGCIMVLRCLFTGILLLCGANPGEAAVRTLGQGETLRFDPSGLPPEMKSAYAIMQKRCTLCHSLERTVVAVTTGIAPISGRPFDRAAAADYGQKMLRKQNSRMSSDEVREMVRLLGYLLDATPPRKK